MGETIYHVTYQYVRLYLTIFVSSDQSFGLLSTDLYSVLNNISFYFVLFEIEHQLLLGNFSKRAVSEGVFKEMLSKTPLFAAVSLTLTSEI